MTTCRATVAALALALAVAAPRSASAQSKADAFAGKIPPVSGQLYRKAGRFEVSAGGDLSLNDAFFTKYFAGLKLGYHLTEAWSISVHGAGGFTARTGSAVVCSATAGCSDATDTQLRQVPGKIRGVAGLEVAWAPVYGKLNVLAEKVAHFDLSLLAGVDGILHDEVLSKQAAEALAVTGGSPASTTSVGGHFGLGARLFLTPSFAVRLELKDYVYGVTVPNAGSGKDWQHQLFTELGVSFLFPSAKRPAR
jgi:outer membrane beta-barrel protein